MMEAFNQTKIESTLVLPQALNSEETNLKLNVIENSQTHDGEQVSCDTRAENNADENLQSADTEEDETSPCATTQISFEAPANKELIERKVNLDDECDIVKEPQGLNNNDVSSNSVRERQFKQEQMSQHNTKQEVISIDEDELLKSDDDEDEYDEGLPRKSKGGSQDVHISEDREEELLRSDDEDLKEKEKINSECDDSLDNFCNEDIRLQYNTPPKENEDEYQGEHQYIDNEGDKSTREDEKEIVSISDEESILSQNEKESEKQEKGDGKTCDENNSEKQSKADEKSYGANKRDYVINLDDETIDDAKHVDTDTKKTQIETTCIIINEESQETVSNENGHPHLKGDNSFENNDDENIIHIRQSYKESKENDERSLVNGNDSSSDDCKVEDNESRLDYNIESIKSESHNHTEVSRNLSQLQEEAATSYQSRENVQNSISNDNSSVFIMKLQLKQECDEELPKINGDHQFPETEEDTNTAVINIQDNTLASIKINSSKQDMKQEILASDDENELECNLKMSSYSSQFGNLERRFGTPKRVDRRDIEDEVSRSSIASSLSVSSGTSSSHQLVIDHPIDDFEVPAVKPCKQPAQVKVALKRKLGETTSSQNKKTHLDLKECTVDLKESNIMEVNYCNGEDTKENVATEPQPISQLKLNIASVAPPKCSELYNEAHFDHSPTRESPLLNSLLTKLKQLPEKSKKPKAIKTNSTKFLCFNCKTGTFLSLMDLNEHQRVCLVNKSILPTSIVPQTPPQSPVAEKTVSIPQTVEDRLLEKKRYYQCSSCGTYHENWNLFLHIREKHKRHMCLYCIRMFPTAEKLSLHLEIKHDLEQNHFNSEETLRKTIDIIQGVASERRFLMCCTCQHVFLENEPFSDHVCTLYMQACSLCGQKGRHSSQCKAQIEANKSKVKRKSMKSIHASKSATLEKETSSSLPPSQLIPISNCEKPSSQYAFQTITSKIAPPPVQQNEDSDSSCNMVIDETCNNSNYVSNVRYNPFKALDERERQEQQTDLSEPDLPPDRNRSDQASEKPAPIQPLIVPKFKLRVPKEFQKSVDAAISSTESEEDDEVHEEDVHTSTENDRVNIIALQNPQTDVDIESATESATEVNISNVKLESKQNNIVDDDDSLDEPNSSLVRILQEIERTKMDIKRTKETLQSTKPLPATARLATISQSSSRTGDQNWSPTPPASPNSQWFTPRRMVSQGEPTEDTPTKTEIDGSLEPSLSLAPPSSEQDRRDTMASDVDMDIDDTISGSLTQSKERSPNEVNERKDTVAEVEETTKIDTSMESNLENSDVTNTSKESDEMTEKSIPDRVKPEPMELSEEQHNENLTEGPYTENYQSFDTEQIILSKLSPDTHAELSDKKDVSDIDVCDKNNELSLKKQTSEDVIEVADEEIVPVELQLDRPLEKFQIVEFVRICLKAVYPLCLYCNHARRIAVNGKSLVLHLLSQHRFEATVDSITAEELKPETIVGKLKSYLSDLEEHYFNLNSYCTMGNGALTHAINERIFECFQCRFVTSTHKELYLHNRKMHLKTAILCFMCRANFFSFSEILCHICPGEPNKVSVFDVKFRCCLCELNNIPSPFRLMVHLRKKHFACDVCLEDCRDQGRLSSHVWKHKLHHLCYRCGIAYRNKMDITKHLFWKHGTESIICKRCLQKRWRHVYHFCVPPTNFVCDVCNLYFSKATYLKVHKRIHTGDLRYPCADENCDQKFISRRLLLKHSEEHHPQELPKLVAQESENNENEPEEKPQEVKDEETANIKEENVDVDGNPANKSESYVEEKKETKPEHAEKVELPKAEEKKTAETACTGKIRKKKKSKRSKESLEDLNLIAPNLSESDSSDDSDVECKSKSGDDSLVPKVILSPLSEPDHEKGDEKDKPETGKVLEIWQNFIQATGGLAASGTVEKPEADYSEDYYPTPNLLHVVQSDHDYCMMFKPESPVSLEPNRPLLSPIKRKVTKSPRRSSTRRSNASSSSSGSSSSSDSSCSCGSNCSCSSSNSDSSSSSSSSDDSGGSSIASNSSKKRHRKKSERDRMRKKSESTSPMKKHNVPEVAKNEDDDVNVGTDDPPPNSASVPKEPLFHESDLETAESDTDEEFYDEHPQKLASELLAEKRAQLMAQTRLSPSHNYDIVENSRPSTPSLPDEVAREKKVKLKKKKRDRKSTSRSVAGSSVQGSKFNFGKSSTLSAEHLLQSHQSSSAQASVPPHTSIHTHRDYKRTSLNHVERGTSLIQQPTAVFPAAHAMVHQLTPRPIGSHHMGRMSEGSSCSDADASLKRSKRARRPNKFYGYTSDDENMVSGFGQPVMIGMRAIKPQPPPQLTWRKEDLPTPSKSILNNKNKVTRTPKTTNSLNVPGGGLFESSVETTSVPKKKSKRGTTLKVGDKVGRKRISKKEPKLPPIPTLKIRPSQIGLTQPNVIPSGTNHIPASQIYSSSKESDDDEEDSTDSSSDEEAQQELLNPATSNTNTWSGAAVGVPPSQAAVVLQASLVLPPAAPSSTSPQASAFNQKIPPALLPNPNFATLQYFKANNIRYPIRPPAGARQAREGESVYCYCRCPYDEVSEMIACDGENCLIEWFHFECVGIMVAPQGKWFCAECRPKYSEELYPSGKT